MEHDIDYVTLEQAINLSYVDFYQHVKSVYSRDVGEDWDVVNYHSPINSNHPNSGLDTYSRPTIVEAIRWFQKERRLVLLVDIQINADWTFSVHEIEESGEYVKQLCFEYTYQKDKDVAVSLCIDWAIKYLSMSV